MLSGTLDPVPIGDRSSGRIRQGTGRKEIEAEAVDALICLRVRRNDYAALSACIGAQREAIGASFLGAKGQDAFRPGLRDISLPVPRSQTTAS